MRTTRPRSRPLRPRTATVPRPAPIAIEPVESRILLAAGTFTGAYFNNADLTSPILTRSDAQINFDWGTTAPATGVAPSTFSVRWTGQIKPTATGAYTFYTTADDGVRLWVGSFTTPLIDHWSDRASLPGDANNDGLVHFTDLQLLARQ